MPFPPFLLPPPLHEELFFIIVPSSFSKSGIVTLSPFSLFLLKEGYIKFSLLYFSLSKEQHLFFLPPFVRNIVFTPPLFSSPFLAPASLFLFYIASCVENEVENGIPSPLTDLIPPPCVGMEGRRILAPPPPPPSRRRISIFFLSLLSCYWKRRKFRKLFPPLSALLGQALSPYRRGEESRRCCVFFLLMFSSILEEKSRTGCPPPFSYKSPALIILISPPFVGGGVVVVT